MFIAQTDSNQRGGGRGIIREGPSRSMCNRHMDKPKGVGFRVGGGDRWAGGCGGVRMETIVLEQQ